MNGSTVTVAGTSSYSPAGTTLPSAGTTSLSLTFTPTDTTDYTTAATMVSLTVNKATPAITWAPAAITYGTTVAGSESGDTESWVVNGSTVTVAGTSSYSPAGTTLPSAGTTSLSLTFTPTDTTDYTTAATTVSLTVNKATPAITWAPAAITYGTTVAGSESGDTESWVVNGSTVTVAGTSSYSPAGTTLPSAGTTSLSLTFTPTDTTDYTTAATTVSLTVNKATPAITWAPAAITYGTTVAGSESGDTESWVVNGSTVTVAGTSSYSPAGTTLPSAGTTLLSLTFTPTDTTDYTTAATTVSLTVNKATPAITWAPAAITYGTTVAGSESGDTESWVVNGSTVTVAGTSSYSPAGTTLPSAGTTSLSLTFTPTDTTDYTTAATTVSLAVNKATPAITWTPPAPINSGTPLSSAQLDATASVAGTYTYNPALGTMLTAGTHTLSVTFDPTDTTDYTSATGTVSLSVSSVGTSLEVTSFTPTATGFIATFNKSLMLTTTASGGVTVPVLHLYDNAFGFLGAPDVTVVGSSTGLWLAHW